LDTVRFHQGGTIQQKIVGDVVEGHARFHSQVHVRGRQIVDVEPNCVSKNSFRGRSTERVQFRGFWTCQFQRIYGTKTHGLATQFPPNIQKTCDFPSVVASTPKTTTKRLLALRTTYVPSSGNPYLIKSSFSYLSLPKNILFRFFFRFDVVTEGSGVVRRCSTGRTASYTNNASGEAGRIFLTHVNGVFATTALEIVNHDEFVLFWSFVRSRREKSRRLETYVSVGRPPAVLLPTKSVVAVVVVPYCRMCPAP